MVVSRVGEREAKQALRSSHQRDGKSDPVTIRLIESYISLAEGGSALLPEVAKTLRVRARRGYRPNMILLQQENIVAHAQCNAHLPIVDS